MMLIVAVDLKDRTDILTQVRRATAASNRFTFVTWHEIRGERVREYSPTEVVDVRVLHDDQEGKPA